MITWIVKQLEAAGLVTCRADPDDNRFTLVALSVEARRLQTTDDMMKFNETLGAQLLEGLDATERAHLLHLLKHIPENVRAIGGDN